MKRLDTMLALTLALGGVVAALAYLLPMDEGSRTSALIGSLLASALGAITMLLKTQLGKGLTGTAALKVLMTTQGLAFMLRLLAVGVGAIVLKQNAALSPFAFVISFFVVSLAQQALETRSLLSSATVKVIS